MLSPEELLCAFRAGSYGCRGLCSGFLLGFTLTCHSLFVAHRTSWLIRRSLLGTRAMLLGTLTALFAGLTFGRLLTLGALGARLTLDRGFRRSY